MNDFSEEKRGEDKVYKRKSISPVLISPYIGILVILTYLYYKFHFNLLSGAGIFLVICLSFGMGIIAGILTERVYMWSGRPIIKIEPLEENRRPHITIKIVRLGLFYVTALSIISAIYLLCLLPRVRALGAGEGDGYFYLFFLSYTAGVCGGTLIPYVIKAFK